MTFHSQLFLGKSSSHVPGKPPTIIHRKSIEYPYNPIENRQKKKRQTTPQKEGELRTPPWLHRLRLKGHCVAVFEALPARHRRLQWRAIPGLDGDGLGLEREMVHQKDGEEIRESGEKYAG